MKASRFGLGLAELMVVLPAVCCFPIAAAAQADPKATEAKMKEAAALPTPQTMDGHPDLTGYWGAVIGQFGFDGTRFITPEGVSTRPLFGDRKDSDSVKGYYDNRANYDQNAASRPVYKSEFRDRQKQNFLNSEKLDPSYHCLATGVPRLGVPDEIFQNATAVVLLYDNPFDQYNHFTYRVVPVDGRQHDADADPMPMGDSVGHWEKDTLVIDVTNVSADTWLDARGSFHDANLHVIERITRRGNTLTYAVTMEDPTMLEQPYSPKPVSLILKPGDHAHEDFACMERDQEHVVYDDKE